MPKLVLRSTIATLSLAALAAIPAATPAQTPVGDAPTSPRTADGQFISWHEHLIDDPIESGVAFSGSDGLVMADLDGDGLEDIVSVHESDTRYDGQLDGHVRIAFASRGPDRWVNITLAEGTEGAAPEDAAIADVNGDGALDVIVAAELAHLIYFQNPGQHPRTADWPRLILPITKDRGSYIRVFFADFDADGTPEAVAPNKGTQNPRPEDFARKTPISIFSVVGDPLHDDGWRETVLGRYSVPQNSEPVDLDGDGDLDIVGGIRGEARLVFFENQTDDALAFREHAIKISGAQAGGFNLDYADINGDDRLDIIAATTVGMAWLEQPRALTEPWTAHVIGNFGPDLLTGIEVADIDGDGDQDVAVGSYSRGPRSHDGDVTTTDPLGRIGWFENVGSGDAPWRRHDISRRKRGMFDKFLARDIDGDLDLVGTR